MPSSTPSGVAREMARCVNRVLVDLDRAHDDPLLITENGLAELEDHFRELLAARAPESIEACIEGSWVCEDDTPHIDCELTADKLRVGIAALVDAEVEQQKMFTRIERMERDEARAALAQAVADENEGCANTKRAWRSASKDAAAAIRARCEGSEVDQRRCDECGRGPLTVMVEVAGRCLCEVCASPRRDRFQEPGQLLTRSEGSET